MKSKKKNKYTAGYFIKKFEKLNNWTTEQFHDGEGSYCALGHCGETRRRSTRESIAIFNLFRSEGMSVVDVNDNTCDATTPYKVRKLKTPKGRIIAALRHIQANKKKQKV